MAVRLTIDTGAEALDAAADILERFSDRSPSSTRWQVNRIAEKLREAASVERQDFSEVEDEEAE